MGRPKKKTVTLTLEELDKLLKGRISEEDIVKTYSYVNYAPYPVSVLEKNFEPYGVLGDSRKDITDNEIFVMKKAKFIEDGILGEKSETPTDGSFSNSMLDNISKMEFDQFAQTVDRIFGIITLNRLLKYIQTGNSARHEKYCLNRITELEKMEYQGSDAVLTNINKEQQLAV